MDILNRVTGLLPEGIGLAPLAGMHWIPTGLFVAVLRGHAPAELDTIAQAIAYLLSEPVQRTSSGAGSIGRAGAGAPWASRSRNAPPEMRGELRRLGAELGALADREPACVRRLCCWRRR